MISSNNITVIDQTIREGMQHRGLMFNLDERLRLLSFQEELGVDISQAAYPPAHKSEIEILTNLRTIADNRSFTLRLAGHCRAIPTDAQQLIKIGIRDFHLHTGITNDLLIRWGKKKIFDNIIKTIQSIRDEIYDPIIKISLLDAGKTESEILIDLSQFLIDELKVDILTIPDTSGASHPNLYYDLINHISDFAKGKNTLIAVHCHNDLGMATGNTILGVFAGAKAIEVSALGIGERNGIGDIFIAGKILKEQDYKLNLNVENVNVFEQYYSYLNELYIDKIGEPLLNYNTPFFGTSISSHVAGTHGISNYGINEQTKDIKLFFNVLTGKNNLAKFIETKHINKNDISLNNVVKIIKDMSAELNRCLTEEEVLAILKNSMGKHHE